MRKQLFVIGLLSAALFATPSNAQAQVFGSPFPTMNPQPPFITGVYGFGGGYRGLFGRPNWYGWGWGGRNLTYSGFYAGGWGYGGGGWNPYYYSGPIILPGFGTSRDSSNDPLPFPRKRDAVYPASPIPAEWLTTTESIPGPRVGGKNSP